MVIDPLLWLFVSIILFQLNTYYLKIKLLKHALIVVVVVIFVAAMPATANYLVKWHEVDISKSELNNCLRDHQSANIIVLAGGIIPAESQENHPLALLEVKSYRRLLSAYDIYKNNQALVSKIYIAGGAGHVPYKEANIISDMLISLGVPDELLVIENTSKTTYENAENLLTIAPELKTSNNILVTSALHMKRAEYSFSHLNVQTCQYPIDSFYIDSRIFIPRLSALYKTSKVTREILAYWVYRLRY
jgi:uncharacterized SAM-binding protein YcdF (DUF218 family)